MSVMRPNRQLHLLHPIFRAMVQDGLAKAAKEGLKAYIFEGWRSRDRQQWLYNQGRTTDGQIVTNALPGESFHQPGLAVDIVFDGSKDEGIQWSWTSDYVESKRPDYDVLGEVMESVGLRRLRNGKGLLIELPHFQLDIGMSGKQLRDYTQRFGDLALWDRVDDLFLNKAGVK